MAVEEHLHLQLDARQNFALLVNLIYHLGRTIFKLRAGGQVQAPFFYPNIG